MTDNQQLGMNLPTTSTVESVEQYQFELPKNDPIKGYPELRWQGKRPFTSTQYYPAQLKEVHGTEVEGWRNKIYWGDNLQVMSHLLKEFRGKVNLVYIDPPFDSKVNYGKKIQLQGQVVNNDQTAFEEKQYEDIWTNDEYLQFLYERMILIRELLSDEGTIYIHCDWHKNHHIRCIADEIFGSNKFVNEIIWWYYDKMPTGGTALDRQHDTIIQYRKGKKFTSNFVYELRENPNRKREVRQKIDGKMVRVRDDEGKQVWAEDDPYKKVSDVWRLTLTNSMSGDRTGYPTQKPETILERIIRASSNPGDIVFDCFMGSGTTQAVAMELGRRFIGADINLGAVQITTKRLLQIHEELHIKQAELIDEQPTYYIGFEVYNVNNYDIFRNPLQAKDLLLEALEVNRVEQGKLFDGEKDGRMVKIMPINRIATRADLNELIAGFDYKSFEQRQQEHPYKPVEKITLVCMGHEPDLAAQLKKEMKPFELDVEVVDILRDKSNLEFKRDSEAAIDIQGQTLVIEKFYPMNLLQKLSLQQENVEDWRELVESVMIDWNYDGAILEPKLVDIPDKNELVKGKYPIPDDAGTIRVKITDLLSESLEVEVQHG